MNVLDAALRYAARGLFVLPLDGKRPHPELAPEGVYSASGEADEIRAWARRCPRMNVGIAIPYWWPAHEDGVAAVLDVDPRNGGDATLDAWTREHGDLPATLTQRTGSGGRHLLFALPKGTYREKIGRGIELLKHGKQFVAAPSVHPDTGKAYAWVSPRGRRIASAPRWLVQLALVVEAPAPTVASARGAAPPDVVDRARKYLLACAPAISGQGGHTATFNVAMKLVRGFALDVRTAAALLAEVWNPTCQPPWTGKELQRKCAQAAQFGRMPVGALRDAERRRSA